MSVNKKTKRIVFVVDATGSMRSYLTSLTDQVLPQCIKISQLLSGGEIQLDAIVYRDYDCDPVVKQCINMTPQQLTQFVSLEKPVGGKDWPEAQKTALNVLFAKYSAQKDNVLVLHYTDAPPHHNKTRSTAIAKEKSYLRRKTPGFDWIAICKELAARNIAHFTFIQSSRCISQPKTAQFYVLAAAAAGGDLVVLPDTHHSTITKATIGVLSQVMGESFDLAAEFRVERSIDASLDVATLLGDENSTGYLPHDSLLVPHKQLPFTQVRPIDWLQSDMRQLPKRVVEDQEFRSVCFATLKQLFVPDQVLCITYNAILGKVWRVLCRFRDDKRLDDLRNALSRCVTALSGQDRDQLQAWIEKSYNQSQEIRELITAVPMSERVPFLVLDGGELAISRKDLLSIATSPSPGVLAQVQKLLCSVVLIDDSSALLPLNDEGVPVCIPLAMSDKQLFSLLCHLLYPGVMFSLRPALVVATIAYLGGNALLKHRAKRFLQAHKGQWIPLPLGAKNVFDASDGASWTAETLAAFEENPEVLSVEYFKLLHKVPQFLTDDERAFYDQAYRFWRLRCAAKKKLSIDVAFTPKKHQVWPDVKQRCTRCKLVRSITIMKNGVCGICIFVEANPESRQRCANLTEPDDCDDNHSHLVQCRTCSVLYAVVDLEQLNVEPKCHYCRECKPSPKTLCDGGCGNAYQFPDGEKKNWTCAVCTHKPERSFDQKDVYIVDLLSENRALRTKVGLNDESFQLVTGHKPGRGAVSSSSPSSSSSSSTAATFNVASFFKLFTRHAADMWVPASDDEPPIEALTFHGKPVHNVSAVVNAVEAGVDDGNLFADCVLCFESTPVNALSSACGKCSNDVCRACSQQWWANLEPGKLVLPTHLFCPFCRQLPTTKTLRLSNRLAACGIVGRKQLSLNANEWYAWCIGCYKIKSAATRECSVQPPVLAEFKCEECCNRVLDDQKHCPACDAPTEKAGGCNHITCLCGAHWCFACETEFGEDDIYEHMNEEHGGYGF